MSEWIDIKKEHIALSSDKKEVEIYFENDNFGARYLNVKVEDLLELLNLNPSFGKRG